MPRETWHGLFSWETKRRPIWALGPLGGAWIEESESERDKKQERESQRKMREEWEKENLQEIEWGVGDDFGGGAGQGWAVWWPLHPASAPTFLHWPGQRGYAQHPMDEFPLTTRPEAGRTGQPPLPSLAFKLLLQKLQFWKAIAESVKFFFLPSWQWTNIFWHPQKEIWTTIWGLGKGGRVTKIWHVIIWPFNKIKTRNYGNYVPNENNHWGLVGGGIWPLHCFLNRIKTCKDGNYIPNKKNHLWRAMNANVNFLWVLQDKLKDFFYW